MDDALLVGGLECLLTFFRPPFSPVLRRSDPNPPVEVCQTSQTEMHFGVIL
jgi:hypothetical protein